MLLYLGVWLEYNAKISVVMITISFRYILYNNLKIVSNRHI